MGMNMASMSMAPTASSTAVMATATATASMHMDMGGPGQCKISMIWNWNTINACFISSTWRITSTGMFAGSCIGVILLVMFLEFVRRMGREYERYVVTRTQSRYRSKISTASGSREELGETPRSEVTSSGDAEAQNNPKHGGKPSFTTRVLSGVAISRHRRAVAGASSGGILRPTFLQQLTRATLHMIQFGLAYFIMLLAMYYNGYFLICILIGAFIGSLIFSWEQVAASNNNSTNEAEKEVTGCCG